MNLVGKILTFLIAVLSLVFMSFALAVNATHTHWRDQVMNPETGLQAKLKKEVDSKKELQGQLERLIGERDAERKAARDVAAALKTEADRLRLADADQKKALADVQGRERKAVEAMTATQNAAANLIAERDQLRKDVLVARNEREDAFKKSVELTDELHQSANELRTLKDKSVTLGQDIAKYNELKRLLNIANVDAFLQKTPPDVKGRVLTVDGTGLVEISLGVDDGLQKGHRLEVYRTGASGATYLGKVEVVEAVPERAVCKIVREFQKGTVQKGDHVASKL